MRTTKKFATCDHPDCDATVEADDDLPEGWRPLSSVEHLTPDQKKRTQGYYLGCIYLEMCPEHVDFFDAHLPQTIGYSGRRGRDGYATVSCSCGTALGRASACHLLNGPEGVPGHEPERAWWRHLPADLKSYYAKRAGAGA